MTQSTLLQFPNGDTLPAAPGSYSQGQIFKIEGKKYIVESISYDLYRKNVSGENYQRTVYDTDIITTIKLAAL